MTGVSLLKLNRELGVNDDSAQRLTAAQHNPAEYRKFTRSLLGGFCFRFNRLQFYG